VPPKVGIIAGTGDLPLRLAESCRAQGRDVFAVTFEGENENPGFAAAGIPNAKVGIGSVGKTLSLLKQHKCEELVLIGKFQRPSLSSLKVDFRGARLLPKVARATGDDSILGVIMAEFEREGFRVVGADTLMPKLRADEGAFGQHSPDDLAQRDIAFGRAVLEALGPFDIGQAIIVERGRVIGIEGPEGTDNLIARCAPLLHEKGVGVLVKARKLGQDERADLPAIGPRTVKTCADAGLAGIAVEADGAIVIDKTGTAAEADARGLFVIGFAPKA